MDVGLHRCVKFVHLLFWLWMSHQNTTQVLKMCSPGTLRCYCSIFVMVVCLWRNVILESFRYPFYPVCWLLLCFKYIVLWNFWSIPNLADSRCETGWLQASDWTYCVCMSNRPVTSSIPGPWQQVSRNWSSSMSVLALINTANKAWNRSQVCPENALNMTPYDSRYCWENEKGKVSYSALEIHHKVNHTMLPFVFLLCMLICIKIGIKASVNTWEFVDWFVIFKRNHV